MNSKNIQINIPVKLDQLVEIIRQLPVKEKALIKEVLDETDEREEYKITEEQKQIVRKRNKLSKANPERLLDWEEAKKKIRI